MVELGHGRSPESRNGLSVAGDSVADQFSLEAVT
jgi:hypothetical protein